MNQHLQNILNNIQQDKNLAEEEKNAIIKSLKDADKEFEITNFKLDRTEKVKRTTAILLEETIEELEQKRKAVEAQNRELEIESSLERVRTEAMSMSKPDDLLSICETMFHELKKLGFAGLRNAMIDVHYDEKKYLLNYDYAEHTGRTITTYVYNSHPEIDNLIEQARQSKGVFTEWVYAGEALNEWRAFRKQHGESDDSRLNNVDALYYYFYSLGSGDIGISTFTAVTKEQLSMLKRFGNVFDLAYRRYIDISNAEAQAQEAKIEASLERMRAAAMSMQKSDEIIHVSESMYKELTALGFTNIRNAQIAIQNETKQAYTVFEYSDFAAGKGEAAYNSSHIVQELYNELGKTKDAFYQKEFSGKEFEAWRKWRKTLPVSSDSRIDSAESVCFYLYSFDKGHLGISTFNPITDEQIQILKRFKKVFELSYQRYTDVSKAEAQAKEAKIELALERVRARTMAMQKSDELGETAYVLFQQFEELGEDPEQIGIGIMNEEERMMELSSTINGKLRDHAVKVPIDEPILISKLYKGWKDDKKSMTVDLTGRELEDYNKFRNSLANIKIDIHRTKDRRVVSAAYFSKGLISLATTEPRPAETIQLLERFAIVFDLTYTRFLDLKKAEAQTKESQIQLALERARSQSMIMQHSTELDDTLRVFHEQVLLLNIPSAFSFLWLPDEEKDRHIFWAAWAENVSPTQLVNNNSTVFKSKAINYPLDRNEPATAQCLIDWKGNEPIVSYHVPPSGVANYFAAWQELIDGVEQLKPEYFSGGLYYVEAFMKYGCFGVMVTNDLKEYEKKILGRFAIEFERTYRRFLDLQKSEAQAREAKIEASLERVRSKAMSMQKSEDLAAAITIVFEELDKLDLGILRCGIGILNKEKRTADVWTTTISDNNTIVQVAGDESMDIHPLLSGAFDAWLNQREHNYTLKGEDLNSYYKAVAKENIKLPASQSLVSGSHEIEQYYYNAVFPAGGLFAFREIPFPEEAKIILKRFADVFSLTYTRFSDLKQAEAQAKEARIEVALERVRSRTLAMQKSDELAETAAVLFRQLILLGIEPNRLYIAIVKDEIGNAEFWITDEDGSKVSSAFETNLNDNPTFKKMFDGWKQEKKSLVIDMQGEELQEYFKYLTSIHVPFKDGLSQKRRLQDIAYFSKGFIGMASPDEQPAETLKLLERFAYTFNLTFTRFNDLQIAEAHAIQAEQDLIAIKEAKQKAEDALTELQVTQKQLIQSEKMASLGELTAGIAHEIQNPLNFVNNFSEVSNELLDEMNEEIAKGNLEEAKVIAEDVKQNLEKINHHGKRADAIVKGMLQHSRSTSSIKEPTDINKLADEYLRLAYHGLRAKDKSFNATLKTDFDESIGNINIIPQDIGRVILNLITNAFYVVNEKTLSAVATPTAVKYEPTVSISTKKLNNKIEISVADNGNGIPSTIKDKIFQPFFTTKPTGQGTGLGLSLSYDIVKAHGGEIKLETREAEGTSFIIQLPINA